MQFCQCWRLTRGLLILDSLVWRAYPMFYMWPTKFPDLFQASPSRINHNFNYSRKFLSLPYLTVLSKCSPTFTYTLWGCLLLNQVPSARNLVTFFLKNKLLRSTAVHRTEEEPGKQSQPDCHARALRKHWGSPAARLTLELLWQNDHGLVRECLRLGSPSSGQWWTHVWGETIYQAERVFGCVTHEGRVKHHRGSCRRALVTGALLL